MRVNRLPAKASAHVKIGDRIDTFIDRVRSVEVVTLVDKRVGAAVAATCFVDHSPPAPVVRRQAPAPRRERGMGRPTKRERRRMDRVRTRGTDE